MKMAQTGSIAALLAVLTVILFVNLVKSQESDEGRLEIGINLASGRPVTATSTCGLGVSDRERYCKLTGAIPGIYDWIDDTDTRTESDYEVIQGQLCDYCLDPGLGGLQSHPASHVVDGTEKWWQSPPLSRGLSFNAVNLTIDLQQEFHVAYVFIKMGNSPRPGVFALEKSKDYGKTWKTWQYFADTRSDCNTFFGRDTYEDHIEADDSVICSTKFSNVVPLEGGEIWVSLVNGRPTSRNFTYSPSLQEWTKATNIRLRLLRTKTLLGHLMQVARQDPTVTRRYFYSIKDITVGGRCVCNGHAEVCNKRDPDDPTKFVCECEHDTCGNQCDKCCPNFIQKPWKPADLESLNPCERCECYGHANECEYNATVAQLHQSIDIHGNFAGGGVCKNCRDNTEGINCDKCREGYYHPQGQAADSPHTCQRCTCDLRYSTGNCEDGTGQCQCQPQYSGLNCERCNLGYFGYPRCEPCQCNINGTLNQVCEAGGGVCPCKPQYDGYYCDRCAPGYYGFPNCQPCDCDQLGSNGYSCEPDSGECDCRTNYGTRNCGVCADGYFGYPSCQLCSCDPSGAEPEICDKDSGFCLCKDNFSGRQCERCAPGSYSYPHCIECGCNSPGSQVDDCDQNGQCVCHYNFAGKTCDRCTAGHFNYPECKACDCDTYGSWGRTCEKETGQCECRPKFEGLTCNKCKANFYNYPLCEECNCVPAGAKEVAGYPLGGCGAYDNRLCECKDYVQGRICDECKPNYWNLHIVNHGGCEDCGCFHPGTTGGSRICNMVTGKCLCKPFASGRVCDQCVDGTYNLQEYNIYGCQDCHCDVGGSLDQICNKDTGQCNCKPRVDGLRCERPLTDHFFSSLYQMQYEMEDGRTKAGGPVRYGVDHNVFPGYSWRGYAIYSHLQDEVLVDVDIEKPSLYRLIFRYMSLNDQSIQAEVQLTPRDTADVTQGSSFIFPTAHQPQHVTVSGSGLATSFVLNPGKWTISLKTPERIFVDYLVLLPQAYYEATILQQKVNEPCTVPATNQLCKHFVYVDISSYPNVRGETGYILVDGGRERTQLYPNREVTDQLGVSHLAHLNKNQISLMLSVPIPGPGKYIFVIQYFSATTGRSQQIDIEVASPSGTDQGRAYLPGCPFSSLCRQTFLSVGEVKAFDLEGTYAVVTLNAPADTNLAVDSITAIPIDQWSVEMIQPRLKCIKRDQQCIKSWFPLPTGTVRQEVEHGPNEDRLSTDVPPQIIDTSVRVIKMDGVAPSLNMKVSVQNPGRHVLVIHYYQPYHTGFDIDIDVTVNNEVHHGVFHANYCPSVSGCREIIHFYDRPPQTHIIDLTDLDLLLNFNSTSGNPVWLDYVLIVNATHFTRKVLEVGDVDKSVEFIKKCAQNEYYVDSTTGGFCHESVFSLVTDFNAGAIHCGCDPQGSEMFSCEQLGGQCRCKHNVIGRTCSQCSPGYFGFPHCRRCNCPTGLCDSESGQCVCPPRVTGPDCDQCMMMTFGYDSLVGCEDCNCDADGVISNNQTCNMETGQCNCKPNVGGRQCHMCQYGYHSFPRCSQCTCEERGSTEMICDQHSATCLCKENVVGPSCHECRDTTFYLEKRNPKGCTQCFCFGVTSECDSSTLRRTEVNSMSWGLINLASVAPVMHGKTIEGSFAPEQIINEEEPIYWIAPSEYLQNKVTSYGGKLTYKVKFRLPHGVDTRGLVKPDVKLEGNNFTVIHTSLSQPVPGEFLKVEVDILETQFVHESTGAPVSRGQFLTVLSNIEALQIRASYYTIVTKVSLRDVSLEVASNDGTGTLARNVEQCRCPPAYRGTSCEECADGFFKFNGVCKRCECNNKADRCNRNTGVCENCQDNFSGPNCIACRPGHFLDPYSNTCKMCNCPGPVNNFAKTCDVDEYGRLLYCHCTPGYVGQRCDMCEYGYWGNPELPAGSCLPCDCSGNIDITDPTSCDSRTGECLKCLNNTAGDRCEECAPWYHGDAKDTKDCKRCDCDMAGSESCDHQTGACLCKPNVVGYTCNQCAPGSFGFESGHGCEACDCANSAYSNDCDVTTGQCDCQPGVGGRRCDRCERDYWNYSPRGCEKCQCDFEGATTCDPMTGRCQCLPGVTGPNCDMCLPRWVLVPDEGCLECDSCIHLLLGDVEIMDWNVTTMIRELESVSVGQGAIRRLQRINDTVNNYRPLVDSISGPQNPDLLDPLKEELLKAQELANSVRNKAERLTRDSQLTENDAADVRKEAEELQPLVKMATDEAENAVKFVEELLQDILNNIGSTSLQAMLQSAEEILARILSRDFTQDRGDADKELADALDLLNRVKVLWDKALGQENSASDLADRLDGLEVRLLDLMNSSRHSLGNSQAANIINIKNKEVLDRLKGLFKLIIEKQTNIQMMIDMASGLLVEAAGFNTDAEVAFKGLAKTASQLESATSRLQDLYNELKAENEELRVLVQAALDHAQSLQEQSEYLESLIKDTRAQAEAAVRAAKAYREIVDALEQAANASSTAVDSADQAVTLSEGLAEKALKSRTKSERLMTESSTVKTQVDDLEYRMAEAKDDVDLVEANNNRTKEKLATLLIGIDALPKDGYGEEATNAANGAMSAQKRAEDAKTRIEAILVHLPEDKEKAAQIPRDIEEANNNVRNAQGQVERVLGLVPKMTTLLDTLTVKAEKVNQIGTALGLNITALRDKILVAQGQANLIKVGVRFYSNTSLQVRNPTNLVQAGSYSRVSLYFRTKERDGFLAYVGPDRNSQQQHPDYMSLEVIDGKVHYNFDLGSGAATLIAANKDVSDGMWHQVVAERIGKSGTLTVRTEDEQDVVVAGESKGTLSVLDLIPSQTRFFVGGVPASAGYGPDVFKLPLQVQRFQGCIESVKFDGVPIGLWNFVQGQNNMDGCYARNKLQEGPPAGFHFDGTGYIIHERQRKGSTEATSVIFNFKTFAKNGLLILMHKGRDFLSVELEDGHLLFQYNLGSGTAKLRSVGTFNDGKWHAVAALRLKKDGILRVDEQSVASGLSSGFMKDLDTDDYLYIGGYKGLHDHDQVTQQGFEGCIKDVSIGSGSIDLNDNIEIKGALPGCPDISRTVSFTPEVQNPYIAVPSVNVGRQFEMTFKVKTLENDGLLFYAADDTPDQQNAFSISMVDGKIMVIGVPEGKRSILETYENYYSDGRWHYITVTKQDKQLRLDVDDLETVSAVMEGRRRIATTSPLYFGGVPQGYSVISENVGTQVGFLGCIGDVTINGEFQNFAVIAPDQQEGTSFAGCPVPDPDPVTVAPSIIPPTFVTTLAPGIPPQEEKCVLPLQPSFPTDTATTSGTRFGSHTESRFEYDALPDSFALRANFSLELKTSTNDGMVFYKAGSDHIDFVGVYLKGGKIIFAFNCGSGSAAISTNENYNDNEWHKVEFKRNEKVGTLIIDDGRETQRGMVEGTSESINVAEPYFLGGLSKATSSLDRVRQNLDGTTSSFVGCLKDFKLNNVAVGEPTREEGTQPCSDAVESGSFFYANGGHIKLKDDFRVGLDLDVNVDIRPRSLNGVILSVVSRGGDFMVLQLVDGKVVFSADNGAGTITATHTPPKKNGLCDGEWHSIGAEKAKNVLTLVVDGVFTFPGLGDADSRSTDTNDPLYVGGVPELHKGILTNQQYVGCIRNLHFNKKENPTMMNLSAGESTGHVDINSCPTN